jgi:hypothetical protein
MERKIITMIPKISVDKTTSDKVRSLLCMVLSFLFSITIVAFVVLLVVQLSCFNKNTFYRNLVSSNYYENIRTDFYTTAEKLTIPTGLSLEVLRNTAELYEIHRDVNRYLEEELGNAVYEVDTTFIENKLKRNIINYLMQEGITPNKEQTNNIDLYVKSIASEYKELVEMPFLKFLLSGKDLFDKIFWIGIVVCIVAITIIIILIKRMNEWPHRNLRYATYSTTAAALMTALVPGLSLYSEFYKRMQLTPQYFYNFAVVYITNILHTFLQFSLCLAITSIVFLITIKKMKQKVRMRSLSSQ